MARAYSLDLRERVVAAVAAGQSCRSAAKTFMVSVASVVKWSQRHRAVGSPAALQMGGHRRYLVAGPAMISRHRDRLEKIGQAVNAPTHPSGSPWRGCGSEA
jgi:transposase